MFRQLHSLLSNRFPAIAWTILIFILLALPGSMLPNENHLRIPDLDKYVHITLFGSFVFFWSYYFAYQKPRFPSPRSRYLMILLIACLYGIAMEYVQKYFIPNRDFDLYDILADVIGALGGYLIVLLTLIRTKRK